jgi:hypothetical protein
LPDEARPQLTDIDGATAHAQGAHRTGDNGQGKVEELEHPRAAAPAEEPPWGERFSSMEELWEAFRNEQFVRGQQANRIGELRRENERLERENQFLRALDHAFHREVEAWQRSILRGERAHA